MKKFYFFFFLFTIFIGKAQIVNIPDANFKAKLLQSSPENQVASNSIGVSIKIDANDDGEIQYTEAQIVVVLDVSDSNISDLTGIEAFVNLSNLFANNNQLTSVSITGLNDFNYLSVNNNQLTNLSIDNTILITGLDASHNQLSSIDVTFKQDCESQINLSYNNLTSFTLQNMNNLGEYVDLSHNQINEIVLDNAHLLALYLSFNNLSSLQIQNNVSIGTLDISNNLFSSPNIGDFNIIVDELLFGKNIVDVIPDGIFALNLKYSSNNSIVDLSGFKSITDCDPEFTGNIDILNSPNLETVILKNGFYHTQITCNEGGTVFQNPALNLNITNCPNLSFICVDEEEQPFIQARINQLGLQNQVQVNSYCSFVPGGEYFDIQGTITFDSNSNGCDVDDILFPNLKFSISDGTNTGTFIANNSGNYQIPVQSGTHTITPDIENPNYFSFSPLSATITFPTEASPYVQNFCVIPNGVHNDLEVTILPIGIARPGFDATYKIVYKNKGNQISSGTVSLSYNDALMDLVNANPINSSSATNILSWDYTNLNPFEIREIIVVFNINAPTGTPAVNNGDVLTFTSNISIDSDETPNDNSFTLAQTVVNSFDPNDKTCLEGTKITPSMVGEYVHYVIRFENTGTASAENIVVADVIDGTKFELESLIPLQSSHDFYTKINNTTGKVEFIFENINLPFDDAANDGYVAFKIRTKPTLIVGDTFSNTANIYFDYNFPITTNTTTTTVALLSNQDFDFRNYFSLYPNPTKNILTITNNQQINISSLSIYNSMGQLIEVITTPNETIDVSNLQAGIYYLKLITDKGMTTQEFIKK